MKMQGFPRIVARDKNTGEIKWEKTYKNTGVPFWATMDNPMYPRFLNSSPRANHETIIRNHMSFDSWGFSDAGHNNNTMASYNSLGIIASTQGLPKLSRAIGTLSNYQGNLIMNPIGPDGNMVYTVAILPQGENRLVKVDFNPGSAYFEFQGRLEAPSDSNIIKSILITKIDNNLNATNSIQDTGGLNINILAGVELEEEIQQDSNTIIDIYYRLILPTEIDGVSDIVNRTRFVRDRRFLENIITIKPWKYGEESLLAGFHEQYKDHRGLLDVSNLSDKFNGVHPPVETRSAETITKENFHALKYLNFYGMLPSQVGSIKNNPTIVGELISCLYMTKNTVVMSNYMGQLYDALWNVGANKKSVTREFPIPVNVFGKKTASADSPAKPFMDTRNMKVGSGEVKAKVLSKYKTVPEYWWVRVTESGNYGKAKAKITKRPFLGTYGNHWTDGKYQIPYLSSTTGNLNVYSRDVVDFTVSSKDVPIKHKYGYEYINGGHRVALSDGHIAISIRTGLMISHVSIPDYEIYDKDSNPALPIKMTSAITYNYNTKEIFVGCGETGLYKVKKSLRDSQPAVITKISGPEKIYAMWSNGQGKMVIASNRGLEFSIDNGASWTTKGLAEIKTATITDEEKFKWINAVATDFNSPNLITMMVFRGDKTQTYGAWYNTDTKAGDITGIVSSYPINFATSDNRNDTGSISIQGPRMLQNIFEHENIKTFLDRRNTPNKRVSTNVDFAGKKITTESLYYYYVASWFCGNDLPNSYITFEDGKFRSTQSGSIAEFDYSASRTKPSFESNSLCFQFSDKALVLTSISNRDYHGGTTTKPSVLKSSNSSDIFRVIHSGININPNLFFLASESISRFSGFGGTKQSGSDDGLSCYYEKALSAPTYMATNPIGYGNTQACVNTIELFKDEGYALVTKRHQQIASEYNSGTGIFSSGIKDSEYDAVFNDIAPNAECLNAGRLSTAITIVWNPLQEYKREIPTYANMMDKPVLVNGQEEFTITNGKLVVDNIELEFNDKGDSEGFKVGDYYTFVNYDGIVNDGSTEYSIKAEDTIAEYSNRVITKSGTIQRAKHQDGVNKCFVSNRSLMTFGREKMWSKGIQSTGTPDAPYRFVIGGFKFKIDLKDLSGHVANTIELRSNNRYPTTLYFHTFKSDGQIYIFPASDRMITLNAGTLSKWKFNENDDVEIEFSLDTRVVTMKKNGTQAYQSGALDSSITPLSWIYQAPSILHTAPSNGSITIQDWTQDKNTWTRDFSKTSYRYLNIVETNSGLVCSAIGDKLEKTGIYDPRFVSVPRVISKGMLEIKIGDKVLTEEDKIEYDFHTTSEPSKNNPNIDYGKGQLGGDFAPANILRMMDGPAGQVVTNIPAGKVLCIPTLGLFIFSDEDIGKTYEIKSGWYKDIIYGIDEFEEE